MMMVGLPFHALIEQLPLIMYDIILDTITN